MENCKVKGWYNFPIGSKIIDFNDKVGAVKYYTSMMLARTQSMFKYNGLPDTIPQRMLELMLQTNGNVCFAKVDDKLYCFTGGLGGEPDAYYRPTIYTIANPYLKFSKSLKINEECIVMPNDSMFVGLMPMFNRYATLLSENDVSIRLADINARITKLISSKDDRTYLSAVSFLKDIEVGKLGVIGENAFLDGIKTSDYGGNGDRTITQLIELQQYLKAGWFNDLGLNANYNMKREAINTSEAQLNDDALLPLVDDMLNCRKLAVEKINAMFGTNISVELNSSWKDIQEDLSLDSEVKEDETKGTDK